ncbi:hypothetical protein PPYR_14194 [Photinus pyralis]|uniref:Uncharacterized protein n=1 Tax=Photinus pyralis TaxID=7054 RepID=A0A5N4A4I7_PHOPY|nr:hypothetical protein PPYR_14194 [Photinus pyralis]
MAPQKRIETVSLAVDSLYHNGGVDPKVHRTGLSPQRWRNSAQSIKSQSSLRTVPEEEDGAETGVPTEKNGGGVRTSFAKNVSSRTSSVTSLTKGIRAYDNGALDEKTIQFERGYNDSTRSSVHESVASLQVQREQYCCCVRWTMFERRLAICVGILAGTIFGLAIAVGLLAGDHGVDEKFVWKP